MKIFLTGGSGFLGSNFIKKIPKKYIVYAITRKKNNLTQHVQNNNINWIEGNLTDEHEELKESDILMHFAAYGVSPFKASLKKALNINVNQSLNLFEQAVAKGVKKFIVIGSSQEYGNLLQKGSLTSVKTKLNPVSNYGISKKNAFEEIKKLCKKKGLLVTYLRVFNAYGINQNKKSLYGQICIASKNGKNLIINNGNHIIDISPVDMISKKIVKFLKFEENINGKIKVINIGGDSVVTIRDFAETQWKILKSKGSLIYK